MDHKKPEHPFKLPKYILDTTVMWESVEQHLQEVLLTSSCFTDKVKASVSEHSQGFLSEVVLLDLDWHPEIPKLPKQIMMKVARSANKEDVHEMDRDIPADKGEMKKLIAHVFKAESSFYEFFKLHEKAYHAASLHIPHFYFKNDVQHGSHAYLIMKYIKETMSAHVYNNFTDAQMDQMLHFIARLQAFGLKHGAEHVAGLRTNMFRTFYSHCFTFEDLLKMYKYVPKMYGDELIKPIDHLLLRSKEIFNLDIGENINGNLMLPGVICHGDLWSTNILWDEKDNDNLRSVVDWQMVHIGCPAEDFIRLFNTCVSGRDRRKNWRDYLKRFYSYLENEMEEVPYYLETLELAYEAMYSMATFIYVPPLVPIVHDVIKLKPIDEQDKLKAVVSEKVRCMIEDALLYHSTIQNK